MPTNRFWGDDVTLTFNTTDDTQLTAAKARSATITAAADHQELFTTDSITRSDVKRREMTVNVELEFVEFNEDIAQHWLEGAGDQTSTTINDDSSVMEYKVTVEQDMTDHTNSSGDESLKAVVDGVHFDEMPLIDLAEGEYSAKSLSGSGDAVTFTKESVA